MAVDIGNRIFAKISLERIKVFLLGLVIFASMVTRILLRGCFEAKTIFFCVEKSIQPATC